MSRSLSIHHVIPLILFFAAGACPPLNAQDTGSIKGTVKDPSGAVVPNAAIQFKGAAQIQAGKSDSKGQFTENLAAGQYSVTIASPGFVTATQNVTVTNGQASPLDVTLEIAVSASQVNVTANQVATVLGDPS